ncbi:MAG TPA: response regulator [Tepidisphaeraceae bacterium]|jgi:DNA-binding response OmpR family regulator
MTGGKPKILITDDERNIRLMLRTALEPEGYAIEEAGDGREALEMIERSSPDLIILDLNMPVLDGMSVLERLEVNDAARRSKVVVLTAYGSIPAAVRATRLGAVDFIEKPVTPDELREMVRDVLAEAAKAPPRPPSERELAGGYDAVLARVRKALRADDMATAESLLMHAADLSAGRDAPYFNLLAVLYEAQGIWRLAKKFYHKAMRADHKYGPAEQNVRRMYELESFARTTVPVALGDEHKPSALEQLIHEIHDRPGREQAGRQA